ncbi:ATP-dependent Clp protease adaptor ClpS family protein [Burkholderia thailandensis]|nr:ATP-dependent Clp protease adaptor ClpS family protein [Burkholderia thailandensis]
MAIIPDKQDSTVLERKEQKLKPPSMYKVVLLNDDFTPMEFVVMIVQEYFKKDRETATQIMLKVHREGRGFVGSIRETSRRPKSSKSLPMRGRPGIRCSA